MAENDEQIPNNEQKLLNNICETYEKLIEAQNEFNKDIVESQRKLLESQLNLEEKRNEQEAFNNDLLENQGKLMEKLDSIQATLDGRKRKRNDEDLDNLAKRAAVDTSIGPFEHNHPPTLPYKFVLRNVFKNVSKMENEKFNESESEKHFRVPWHISVVRRDPYLAVFLFCDRFESKEKWSVNVDYELKLVHPNNESTSKNKINNNHSFVKSNGSGFGKLLEWEEMVNGYLVDDRLTVEAHITINSITGIYKDDLRSFDESTKDFSDIVLIVQGKKFYVSKLFLAAHSSYFRTMFLKSFEESNKSEITLTEIDSDDFQKYLEVLYGEPAIDDNTVEGIAMLGDMYDTEIVIRKCQDFLIKESKIHPKKGLHFSIRYNLEKLRDHYLSKIKSTNDIRYVLPEDINEIDPSLAIALLQKSLSFK